MKKSLVLSILLTIAIFPSQAKRHSQSKKSEKIDQSKTTQATNDTNLTAALHKQTKTMTFEEAKLAKEYYAKKNEAEMIIKCGQRLLAVGGDQEVMRITRLELAEVFLEKQNYTEAEKYAQEYQKFYPGAKETPRAEYIAIQANYLAKLNSDRDQVKTLKAITLAKDFLEKHPTEKEYSPTIKHMMRQCYKSLIRSEIHVINTHLNTYRNNKKEIVVDAAQKRLAYIKNEYLPHAPEAEKRLQEVELRLAQLTKQKTNDVQQPKLVLAQSNTPAKKKTFIESVKGVFIEDDDEYFA